MSIVKRMVSAGMLAAVGLFGAIAVARAAEDPRALLRRAIEAQGGEARLRQVQALQVEIIGHRYLIEQSERPEGPWIASYDQRTELRDLAGQRLRVTTEARAIQTGAWTPASTSIAEGKPNGVAAAVRQGKIVPARAQLARDAADLLALEPERLLLTALAAADLKQLPAEHLQEIAQQVVTFTANGRIVRLFLNAHTLLATAVDVIADDGTDTWGEVTRRTLFSYWNVESNGLLYPRQRNVLWNGVTQGESSIVSLTINPEIPADAFTIPDDVRRAFASAPQLDFRTVPLGQRTTAAQPAPAAAGTPAAPAAAPAIAVETLAEGVIQIPGLWNVAMVQQPDGLVIIEAPISSEYSAQVLDEAARRFPGVKVKAVVTTSDAWPHFAGLREYAARGVPIYALDLNKPIIDRLLAARYTARPDRLARTPRAAELHLVTDRTAIGSGAQQIVLHPVRGENGERMMLAHLPGRRLLYTSDEVMHASRDKTAFFMPSFLVDVQGAVTRAGIPAVDTIFGMHLTPTPWSVFEAALAKARPAPPAGSQP